MSTRRKSPVPDSDRPAAADLARRLRLVAITPADADPGALVTMASRAAAGGATAVMLRRPGAPVDELVAIGRALSDAAKELGFFLIVNGPPEAAALCGAGAVHLGVRTVRPRAARRILPAGVALGYSVHAPFENRRAEIAACDYITYSPVFPTPSKPGAAALGAGELMRAVRELAVPVVALGGIGPREARELAAAGCACIAAISSVMGLGDPAAGAAALRSALDEGRAAAGPPPAEERGR